MVKIIRLKRCHLGRDVINSIKHILLFAVIILYSCEDMYEPEKDYIDCTWFQYAEQQIYNCEDVWLNGCLSVSYAYMFGGGY